MSLLERLGTRTPRRAEVTSRREALDAAARVGYPCVLKLLEPFMAHRARVGAVEAGIDGPERLAETFDRMTEKFGMTKALVAEQIQPGPELIAGVLSDATFGSRAVLGSGGIWANEIGDARTLVPPYDAAYVRHELGRLKLSAQFGEDGAGEGSRLAEELAAMLTTFGAVVRDPAVAVAEIECNPVRVVDGGVVVLDALAITAGREG
jgi:hypothetical protein